MEKEMWHYLSRIAGIPGWFATWTHLNFENKQLEIVSAYERRGFSSELRKCRIELSVGKGKGGTFVGNAKY